MEWKDKMFSPLHFVVFLVTSLFFFVFFFKDSEERKTADNVIVLTNRGHECSVPCADAAAVTVSCSSVAG